MSKVFKSEWPKAYAFSIIAHIVVVAVIVGAMMLKPGPIAGSGRMTVTLGGAYGGDAGGLGDRHEDGSLGNLGEGGDGRTKTSDKPSESKNLANPAEEAAETKGEVTDALMNHVEKAQPVPEPAKAEPVEAPDAIQKVIDSPDATETVPVKKAREEPKKPTPKAKEVKKDAPEKVKKPVEKKATVTEKAKPNAREIADDKGKDKAPQTEAKTKGIDGDSVKAASGGTGAAGSPGTNTGKKLTAGSGVGTGQGQGTGEGKFIDNGDGTYTAMGSGGISYHIIRDAEPKYPRAARSIGFGKKVKVTVKFLVGVDGHVEDIHILNKKLPDLGFREEAVKAVRQMEFEPIKYNGKPVKMHFRKVIYFMP